MERLQAMTTLVLVATTLAAASSLIAGGEACDNIPSLTMNETCAMACKTPHLLDVCKDTLKDAPYISAMTVYAVRRHTVYEMAKIVSGGLPGDERAAYLSCTNRYATARLQMVAGVSDMNGCQFARTTQEYVEAVAAVKTCGEKLSPGWPLVADVAGDLDVTTAGS
ncbi:hypothetical protein HU200_028631 [Digitaria exilis]|uniref:Pectinesterase inhibitor domain-containing protein n=1 Tax=Digitaria exilis TaxID=1010633 RepID=A0A835EVP7_9POAL|nr:hypothetical protein HU200_028631 [Digitaria exilis]